MELHCNVFELAAHMVISFPSSLSNSLKYNIKFFFYLFNFSSFFFFISVSLPVRTRSRSLYCMAAGLRSSSCSEWMVKGRSVSHLVRSIARHGSSEHNLFLPHHFTGGKMDRLRENWPAKNVIRERRQGDEGEVQASSY